MGLIEPMINIKDTDAGKIMIPLTKRMEECIQIRCEKIYKTNKDYKTYVEEAYFPTVIQGLMKKNSALDEQTESMILSVLMGRYTPEDIETLKKAPTEIMEEVSKVYQLNKSVLIKELRTSFKPKDKVKQAISHIYYMNDGELGRNVPRDCNIEWLNDEMTLFKSDQALSGFVDLSPRSYVEIENTFDTLIRNPKLTVTSKSDKISVEIFAPTEHEWHTVEFYRNDFDDPSKIKSKIENITECYLRLPNEEEMIGYKSALRHFLKNCSRKIDTTPDYIANVEAAIEAYAKITTAFRFTTNKEDVVNDDRRKTSCIEGNRVFMPRNIFVQFVDMYPSITLTNVSDYLKIRSFRWGRGNNKVTVWEIELKKIEEWFDPSKMIDNETDGTLNNP